MDRDAALEKIRKCLALSRSPNENEARTALLMARRLMIEYKIGSLDEISEENQNPETRETPFAYTTITNPWMFALSVFIASRYCCRSFALRGYGKKTRRVGFVGLSGDLEVCVPAFELAATTIIHNVHHLKLDRASASSYAEGFMKGMKAEYEKQDAAMIQSECTETALATVTSVPDCVNRHVDENFNTVRFTTRVHPRDESAYSTGYADGCSHLRKKVDGRKPRQLE